MESENKMTRRTALKRMGMAVAGAFGRFYRLVVIDFVRR